MQLVQLWRRRWLRWRRWLWRRRGLQLTHAFDVVDVLGGFATLARRSKTLGGSVPLRVAQACVPLLEGNGFGFQVTVRTRIDLVRRLGAWSLAQPLDGDVQRRFRAVWPMLLARGWVRGAWARGFQDGPVALRARLQQGRAPVELFTGLLVRPRTALRLRVASNKNRRSLAYDVREAILDDASAFTPLVLCIDPRESACTLHGELATLAVLPAHTTFAAHQLADAPDVARAHLDFYDRAYFETKRGGEVVRSYRKSSRAALASADAAPHVDYVDAGVLGAEPAAARLFHRPDGPTSDPAAPPDRLVVRNPVSLTARFDGLTVDVRPDPSELAAFAARVRTAWSPFVPPDAHQGALLYLTKLVTPHPPGEPHFFVKPSVLFRTGAGTSTVLEGASFEHGEVLRGVVETDWFHAAPAVFHVGHGALVVPAGAPILELFAWPRRLEDATFELERPELLP